MKRCNIFATVSLLFAIAVTSRAQSNNTTTLEDVKQAGKNAAATTGNYTEQQIKELDKSAEKQFRALRKKLNDLKSSAQSQTGQARADMDKKIAEAQKKLDDLKPTLDELKVAATNAWGDVKSAFDNGIKDIQQRLQQ